jgi:hypothetical protein
MQTLEAFTQIGRSYCQVDPLEFKEKAKRGQVLKVCPRDCFVISTTRNAAANPRYGFGPSSEVTSNKKQSLTYEKVSFRFKRSCGGFITA